MHLEIIRIFSAPSAFSAVKRLFYDFVIYTWIKITGDMIVAFALVVSLLT